MTELDLRSAEIIIGLLTPAELEKVQARVVCRLAGKPVTAEQTRAIQILRDERLKRAISKS